MQVTETLSEGLRRGFTVVVPAADIEGKRSAKLSEIGRGLKLPGFRPGKIPASLVRQRYGTAVMAVCRPHGGREPAERGAISTRLSGGRGRRQGGDLRSHGQGAAAPPADRARRRTGRQGRL